MNKLKYPTLKKPFEEASVSTKNRGLSSEKLVNEANEYYLLTSKAVIHKKPTPIQIVNVHYPKRSAAKITEAYFKTPSTTDYNGLYHGVYIDFDVKETKSKTSFPLSNIHSHQVKHLKHVHDHFGFAFLMIALTHEDLFYILPFESVEYFIKRSLKGRKSMTLDEIKTSGFQVPLGFQPTLDYLKTIDQIPLFQRLKKHR